MRVVSLGLVLGAGLVLAGLVSDQVLGQRFPEKPGGSESLIAVSSEGAEGRKQIVVIEPKTHVMCVYQVDPKNGEIALKSARNIHWDLQMDEFNGVSPSPREIRALLQQR